MESSSYTFYFEEVFPTLLDFETFIGTYSTVVNLTDPIDSAFNTYCYNVLSRHYNHCNIRYSTMEAFKGEFLNVYDNKFLQFKREQELAKKVNALTDDDLAFVRDFVSNYANNPNEDNPLNTDGFLGYISQQTFNKETANRLRSYLDALNNAPSMNIYKFFKANKDEDMGFDDLFMNVQPNVVWFYKK